MVSTLAATTCSSVFWPALLRENLDLRGRMAWIIARPSPVGGRRATQSPTAGWPRLSGPFSSWRSLPERSA